MPSDPQDDSSIRQFILRQVLHNIRCGACGARYGDGNVTVVEGENGIWVLTAVCPGCDTHATILVVVQEKSVEIETLGCISLDDVIDFHVGLAAYRGDLRDLLDTNRFRLTDTHREQNEAGAAWPPPLCCCSSNAN